MNLSNLVERHLKYYEKHEKKDFDRARRYYQGKAWKGSGAAESGSSDAENAALCSKNLIYAIADTAIASLLGPNPKVAPRPRNPMGANAQGAVGGLLEYVFDANQMRSRAATTLIDAVLVGRGAFKTLWDESLNRPVVKEIDPAALFFDRSVRNVADIKYWLEASVIPWEEFQERVGNGWYKHNLLKDAKPDKYPAWLQATTDDLDSIRDAYEWITVYEYYDVKRKKCVHYVKGIDGVVYEDPKWEYVPYSMYALNQNSADCGGLSEVRLVLNQQQTVNELLTHVKKIVYLMIPRILYDAGRITGQDLAAAVNAATGAFVGVSADNSETLRSFAGLFYDMPMPQPPEAVTAFIDRMTDDAAYISALADASRGKVTGARTATEMAIIDAQLRTRLATREGHLNAAIEDVAGKCYYLCRKYMKGERLVRVTGSERWEPIQHKSIHDVEMDFQMVSYNPVRQNPAVIAEALMTMLPFFAQRESIDQWRLDEEAIKAAGLPNIQKDRKEFQAQQEAAMQAMAAQMGAAPAEGIPAPANAPMPAEASVEPGGAVAQQPLPAEAVVGGNTPLPAA